MYTLYMHLIFEKDMFSLNISIGNTASLIRKYFLYFHNEIKSNI